MQSAHARQCLREVRTCRRLVPGLTFDLHFGVILGTKFVTILLSACPGAQKGAFFWSLNLIEKNSPQPLFPVPGNGGGGCMSLEKHQQPRTQDPGPGPGPRPRTEPQN